MAQELAENPMDETPTTLIPPEQSTGYQVRRLNQAMSDAMDRFVGRLGISSAQWGYLRNIYFEDGMSQRELSDRIGRQGATTVTALKRLEKLGYVETRKNPNDQRKNRVYLTDQGRALVAELMPHVKDVEAIAFEGFRPAEVDAFRAAIARMRENFAAARSRPWTANSD